MGMYTELILGAKLSKNTPAVCIKALDAVINHYLAVSASGHTGEEQYVVDEEVREFIEKYQLDRLFWCSSYYFGVNSPNLSFWVDSIDGCWHISTRSNLKNYDDEIENFLEYLKPYIEQGSGESEIFAYVIYEEDTMPTIYSLKSLKKEDDDPIRYSGEGTN